MLAGDREGVPLPLPRKDLRLPSSPPAFTLTGSERDARMTVGRSAAAFMHDHQLPSGAKGTTTTTRAAAAMSATGSSSRRYVCIWYRWRWRDLYRPTSLHGICVRYRPVADGRTNALNPSVYRCIVGVTCLYSVPSAYLGVTQERPTREMRTSRRPRCLQVLQLPAPTVPTYFCVSGDHGFSGDPISVSHPAHRLQGMDQSSP